MIRVLIRALAARWRLRIAHQLDPTRNQPGLRRQWAATLLLDRLTGEPYTGRHPNWVPRRPIDPIVATARRLAPVDTGRLRASIIAPPDRCIVPGCDKPYHHTFVAYTDGPDGPGIRHLDDQADPS